MRKCLGIIAAGLLAFGSAHASPILVDPTAVGSSVTADITSSRCIGCFINVSLSDGLEGSMAMLDIGDSYTFDFIDVMVGAFIGGARVAVDATLALASPTSTVAAHGFGGFASFMFVINGGYLTWIQPEAIALTDGTFLGVSFENLFEFGIGNTTTVSATISRYGVASVPEPGTAALLIVGLLALWFTSRRRRPVGRSQFSAVTA